LPATINAIQFLWDIGLVEWDGRLCSIKEELPYDRAMGVRANKIYKATPNISALIASDIANAYTNLRIQL